MILYQVATAVSTLSPALCLHAAGAGDMGRVAALAPDTRLLCTDQVEPLSHILRAAAQYFFQGSTHPRRFSEVSDLSYFKEAFKKMLSR